MPYLFYDPTLLFLIPAIILSLWAQFKVKSTFNKYSKVKAGSGMTGAELSKRLLQDHGLSGVEVEEINGNLSDHYDPRSKVLRLSSGVARSRSVAALGVAAHEVGHAVQHQEAYQPFQIRQAIAPAVGLGSKMAFPLILIGLIMSVPTLLDIGIIFFSGAVLFQLVTLPVEFNASGRALAVLKNRGYLAEMEVKDARKVLYAAALTYVAATAVAVLQLIRLLVLRNARD
ncbi:zinc metallopeptidase [bacterium]|nr:zinc metallopeptidase [bacterium]